MEKFKSRKFWFAFIGALMPVVGQYFSASISFEEAIQVSAAIIISYIFGQSWLDSKIVESTNGQSEEG